MEDADVLKSASVKASILDIFTRCSTKYQSSFKGIQIDLKECNPQLSSSFIQLYAGFFEGRVFMRIRRRDFGYFYYPFST